MKDAEDGLTHPPVISHFQAQPLIAAHEHGETSAETSLDLEISRCQVLLDDQGVHAGGHFLIDWADLSRVAKSENACFEITEEGIIPIRAFSEDSNKIVQLMPTAQEPALLISGFVMHRLRDVSPSEGARRMVRALSPLRGRLLDTATGLGYAAIEAVKYASEVITIEVEPLAQRMARKNPWSKGLFTAERIRQKIGDSAEVIRTLDDGSFQNLLHDPPAINTAGALYSLDFYKEAFRVLSRGGKFFHYIGDPESTSGKRTTEGVLRRLREAGFQRVLKKPDAFGVLALK